jgi:hypothetical protein
MDFSAIFTKQYLPYTIGIALIIIFIIYRSFKSIKMYIGARSYVRKSKRLRKRKYNGLTLVEYTKKKRKKNTNNFSKLRRRAKKKVKQYFTFKSEELPVVTRYAEGKLLKSSKKNTVLIVRNDQKVLKRIKIKNSQKNMIQVVDKYECLNEFLSFLHHLPDAILEKQDYDIYIPESDILITYEIK